MVSLQFDKSHPILQEKRKDMKLECDAYKFSTFSYLPFKLRFQTKKKVT